MGMVDGECRCTGLIMDENDVIYGGIEADVGAVSHDGCYNARDDEWCKKNYWWCDQNNGHIPGNKKSMHEECAKTCGTGLCKKPKISIDPMPETGSCKCIVIDQPMTGGCKCNDGKNSGMFTARGCYCGN